MIVLINRGCSIAAIICFILLAASLIIAQNSIATGYELDLYGNTPLLTWVFLTLSVICGISILILQIATKGYKVGYLWIVGLLLLVTTRVSLLCIPYIRGYGPWRGDNLYHLGLVRDILSNGYLTEGNFYPIMHILITEITFTAGIPYYIVAALSTPFVSALFVLTTYMLATAILPRKGQQILATGLAAVVMIFSGYDLYLMPVGWTLFLLPLLLFFYFKQSTTPYRILFLILLVSFPFFHPFTAVMVILSLIILELSRVSLVHISRHNKEITQRTPKRI